MYLRLLAVSQTCRFQDKPFLDFLLSGAGQRLIEEETGLPRINEAALAAGPHLRPIRLDPG